MPLGELFFSTRQFLLYSSFFLFLDPFLFVLCLQLIRRALFHAQISISNLQTFVLLVFVWLAVYFCLFV